jgi:hypothetical protein
MSTDNPPEIERMRRLGEAYGLSPDPELGAIADAIISEPNAITPGMNDKEALINLLAIVVSRNGVLTSLQEQRPLEPELVAELRAAALSKNPALPAPLFVESPASGRPLAEEGQALATPPPAASAGDARASDRSQIGCSSLTCVMIREIAPTTPSAYF